MVAIRLALIGAIALLAACRNDTRKCSDLYDRLAECSLDDGVDRSSYVSMCREALEGDGDEFKPLLECIELDDCGTVSACARTVSRERQAAAIEADLVGKRWDAALLGCSIAGEAVAQDARLRAACDRAFDTGLKQLAADDREQAVSRCRYAAPLLAAVPEYAARCSELSARPAP